MCTFKNSISICLPLWATLFLFAGISHGDLLSQKDTFDSGVEGWGGGLQAGGTGPVHVSSGGPDGSGYVRISHVGFHLGTKNTSQWTGNYLSAGVTALTMDLRHLSGDALNVRVVLFGAGGLWASTGLQSVGNNWNSHSFGVTAADLVYVNGGSGIVSDTLGGVTTLLIRHDTLIPTLQGEHPPHVTAAMGIDNIAAVPEPGTLAYLLVGGISAILTRQYRRRDNITIQGNSEIDNFS